LPRSKPAAKRPAKRRTGKPQKRTKTVRSAPGFSEAKAATWFEGKTFATDWTSWHFPNWAKLLAPYCGKRTRIMEIGSWEGRSALFFVNYLPRAHVVCIDTFEGGQEHQAAADSEDFLPHLEKRFESNTAEFASRIEKIKARSTDALARLGIANRRFDIAYIDGSHRAADVYSDAALTWPLMAPGALVIFDDYQWEMMPDPLDNPKRGIDAFLEAFEGQYRIVHNEYQVAVVKR
jgi:predicted O-methyltransferase YrrM